MTARKLYLRKCSYCGLGMSRGYVMGSGDSYVCDRNDKCYQNFLIDAAIWYSDNDNFKNSEDKIDWIEEVNDQLYVGWTEEHYVGELYTAEGVRVQEEDIKVGEDILAYSEEESEYPYDYMMYSKAIGKDTLVW